jgi:glucoamylase
MDVNGESTRVAPGGPGLPPRWTRGAKEAVGTAYSTASRVWYTVAAGILTEVFYPTIDTPQIRDLQYLVTDGRTFFHDERRNTTSRLDCVDEAALGFEIVNVAENGLYTIRKTLIGHPHQDCVLMRTRFEGDRDVLRRLQVYVLCAPHLEIGGWHNNAAVLDTRCGRILVAYKGATWMALGATVPMLRFSCGYVAVNDGWTDLHDDFTLGCQYDAVYDGNIAVTGQMDLSQGSEFTLGLAFGDTRHRAITNLFQSLVTPFAEGLQRFRAEWTRTSKRFALAGSAVDQHASLLYERSVNLLLAHEDKSYPGAMIAALSIPWGSSKGDEELGGYHLVWTRDSVQSATALLAAGDTTTPLRVLVYLAVSQRADGGFYQNFWIDGRPYWTSVQLDEVSFPVVLAWRLKQASALGGFKPDAMVAAACGFLIREGPATAQERWEEAAGYSPSTLAINIAALICGADLMDDAGDSETARFVREYADFLESHVDRWTVTTQGSLVPGIARHYIRINPDAGGKEDPDTGTLVLANQPPGGPYEYEAKDIVDAGFLELVRYGIRAPRDPIIEDSVRVVDAVLKVETPAGPCWRRYNHDGYGQRADGTSYRGWGVGRPWPLLTGERGHYELAAGRDATPYRRALEAFAVGIGLIPEQIWDGDAIPGKLLRFGGPTGAAIPIAWAHAEYIKLVRSIADRQVFDSIEPVRARYASRSTRASQPLEIWSRKRPIGTIPAGCRLRVIAADPFSLGWTSNDWHDRCDTPAISTTLGVWYVDLDARSAGSLRFRFIRRDRDEGLHDDREYVAQVVTSPVDTSPRSR